MQGLTIFGETAVFQIGMLESLIGIGTAVLVVGIAWGRLNTSVLHMSTDIKSLKDDVKDVRERFAALEGKNSGLYNSHSPISLTDGGRIALRDSGLEEYIDDNKERLIATCDQKSKMRTPYDVQQCAFDFFDSYNFPQEVDDMLKTYAYNQGISMDVVRRVGALYFRDICLKEKGFELDDIKD